MTDRWQPRCEGCGVFVPADRALSDYRWCGPCLNALPTEAYMRHAMIDRYEAERLGFRPPSKEASRAA